MADYGHMKGIVLPPRDLYRELEGIEARGRRLKLARRSGFGVIVRTLFRATRPKPAKYW